jgi:hypothetical protein
MRFAELRKWGTYIFNSGSEQEQQNPLGWGKREIGRESE